MSKSPVASVIIPTYNHSALVPEAIRSALAQTAPFEIIVVDDGSTDDTEAALAAFGDAIRVIRLPHGGPSLARNAGLEAATAEWVMFLDADDVIEPGKVAAQIAAADPAVGWVLCDVEDRRGCVRQGGARLCPLRLRRKETRWMGATATGGRQTSSR